MTSTQRVKLTLEYDGSHFCGFQRQANDCSVQSAIEKALHKFCGFEGSIQCAGRTDAGVHALGQVVHADLPKDFEDDRILRALNYYLYQDAVKVRDVAHVPHRFSARFDCIERQYRYRILNRLTPPVLDHLRVWHVPQSIDLEALRQAGQILVGHHDFSAFRSAHCQGKSPVRTLDRFDFIQVGEEIWAELAARSFLHNQVRIMVGTLMNVGIGKWPLSKISEILSGRDRTKAGETAPAHGLYFMAALYPEVEVSGAG